MKHQIEEMLKAMEEARKNNTSCLNIRELLDKLEKFDGETIIKLINSKFLDGQYDSYRGYYIDLALGFSDEDHGISTVNDLKNILMKALNDGEMYGYKGGDYSIVGSTLVWLGNYGTTHESEMIVDVKLIDGQAYIISVEEE